MSQPTSDHNGAYYLPYIIVFGLLAVFLIAGIVCCIRFCCRYHPGLDEFGEMRDVREEEERLHLQRDLEAN